MAQMRSPSPEPDADSLSDAEEASATSEPSPPVRSPYKAATASRAMPDRTGQNAAHVSPHDHTGPGLSSAPLAAKRSVNHEPVTAAAPGVNNELTASAQAGQGSILPTKVSIKQTGKGQDAAQQTASSPHLTASDKQDVCVQSELPIMPNHSRHPPSAVPTDERGTQTPIGHASPRALQKAPPGRDPQWSPRNAAQEFESQSPAQPHGYLLRHERASPLIGTWPRRQSPPPQWSSTAFDPSMAAHRDAPSDFTSAVPAGPGSDPRQHLPKYTQGPAQRLFCSPPPDGDRQQLAMQPSEHLPAEQQSAASDSQAQQQDSDVRRAAAAEPFVSLHEGYQDADHPPAGSSSNPAEAWQSAASVGDAKHPAQLTVSAAALSGSDPTAPPTARPTQAQAEMDSAWLTTPAGVPHITEPSLRSWAAHTHAHLPPHAPSVPQHQAPRPPGEGYAYTQALPFSGQQAVLDAHARGMNRGWGAEHRAAGIGAAAGVVQRQQGQPSMYGLPRRMYAGADSLNWSGQILYPASQLVTNLSDVGNVHLLQCCFCNRLSLHYADFSHTDFIITWASLH